MQLNGQSAANFDLSLHDLCSLPVFALTNRNDGSTYKGYNDNVYMYVE